MIIAGLLLGGRGAVVTAVLNIITLTVLLILTEAKVIPPPEIPNKPADIWANLCIGIGLAAALLYLTTNSIDQALTTARRNARRSSSRATANSPRFALRWKNASPNAPNS